ncbi:MAG TPA: sterol desaturase family protein [Candidatus Acidoferrum sp.]|nr:sterol desaturase family protein [Candidatus Acidoferrum sp.]
MTHERFHATFVGVVATLVDSIVVAELAGYWLHRLLHSDRFPAFSRGHLIHHFLIYGPRQPMRAAEYQDATDNRFSVGNIGLEWLVPSAVILLLCWGAMLLLGVPRAYQVLSLCTLLAWPLLMFSYLHDRMHLKNFWMTRVPLLKTWFLKARRLHDIHHRSMNRAGFMDTNFGIGFYFFDRFFRTLSRRHRPFSWAGYRAAIERYGLDETDLMSLRRCSEALFSKSEKLSNPPQEPYPLRRVRR